MSSTSRPLVLALAISAVACASTPAPRGWLSRAMEAQSRASGGWISLNCGNGEHAEKVAGELIALDADRLYVLTEAGRFVTIPQASVRTATFAAYATGAGDLARWSVLGTLSTISHGGFLLFTAPMWIITGAIAAEGESRAALIRYPEKPLASLRPYARLPQGLPPGFDGSSLGGADAVCGEPVRAAQPGIGWLRLRVVPWAEVIVDERLLGTTPLEPLPLPPGVHRVQLRHPSFAPVAREVVIRSGETALLEVDLSEGPSERR